MFNNDVSEFPAGQQEYLEILYNHKEICETLINENTGVSKALFQSKIKRLVALNDGPLSPEVSFILLTSLNRSLYDYFLFHQKLSFARCCYQNRPHMYHIENMETLANAGDHIIEAYAVSFEAAQTGHSHIERACSYIQSHLGDDLSLSQVSSELFLSKSHLCYIFRMLMGTTFCDYVRQQRIQYARTLLLDSEQSIDDIACACGFHSSTYFATVFKSEMGMSPSAFRREIQSEK